MLKIDAYLILLDVQINFIRASEAIELRGNIFSSLFVSILFSQIFFFCTNRWYDTSLFNVYYTFNCKIKFTSNIPIVHIAVDIYSCYSYEEIFRLSLLSCHFMQKCEIFKYWVLQQFQTNDLKCKSCNNTNYLNNNERYISFNRSIYKFSVKITIE